MVEPLVQPAEAFTVRVLVDGVHREGLVHAWRRSPDGWRAYVSWYVGIGEQYLGWMDAAAVRRMA
jgi:hypothetical protein